jgi:hypothetical protein
VYGCLYAKDNGAASQAFSGTPAPVACSLVDHIRYVCPNRLQLCPCCGDVVNPSAHGTDSFVWLTGAQSRFIVDRLDSDEHAGVGAIPMPGPPSQDPSPVQGLVPAGLSGPAPINANAPVIHTACKYGLNWVVSCVYCRKSIFNRERVQHERQCAVDYANAIRKLKRDQQVRTMRFTCVAHVSIRFLWSQFAFCCPVTLQQDLVASKPACPLCFKEFQTSAELVAHATDCSG